MGHYRTTAAAVAAASGVTTSTIDLSALTLTHDPDGLIASTTSSAVNFTATTGSNAGEDWARWAGPALVADTFYTITIRDTAPATDRRGIGVGWIDANNMALAGFFNSAGARECFAAAGSLASPTETLIAFSGGTMTAARVSFYVSADDKTSAALPYVGTDDASNLIGSDVTGSGSTEITLASGVLHFCARRGTNNGAVSMGYVITVESFSPSLP